MKKIAMKEINKLAWKIKKEQQTTWCMAFSIAKKQLEEVARKEREKTHNKILFKRIHAINFECTINNMIEDLNKLYPGIYTKTNYGFYRSEEL